MNPNFKTNEGKKSLVWIGAIIIMIFIMISWGFFLKKNLSHINSQINDEDAVGFSEVSQETKKTFDEIKEGFEKYKENKEVLKEEDNSDSNEEVVEEFKEKFFEQTQSNNQQ